MNVISQKKNHSLFYLENCKKKKQQKNKKQKNPKKQTHWEDPKIWFATLHTLHIFVEMNWFVSVG